LTQKIGAKTKSVRAIIMHLVFSRQSNLWFVLEINRYHFFETDTDIFNFLHRYLASCRYSIGHRYRYSKICLPIF